MIKIIVGSLLALTAINAFGGDMYVYKDEAGQTIITHVDSSNGYSDNQKVTSYIVKEIYSTKSYRNIYVAMADDDGSLSQSIKQKKDTKLSP